MSLSKKQRKNLIRILISAVLMLVLHFVPVSGIARFLFYLVPYLVVGYDILIKAAKGVRNRQPFDECLLMAVATIGAIALALFTDGDYTEAIAVMLFYQIGEWFQSYAVGKSRRNISALMDIRPDYANIALADGRLDQVDPDELAIGTEIVVLPGEKIPIDGIVAEGTSVLNTSALTGESLPRDAGPGDEVISGCVNGGGLLKIRTTKEFGESTVSKILDLVENASSRKSRAEDFITRFARIYTPAVVYSALALALLPPLVRVLLLHTDADAGTWIYRALTFLVISCPCALVISIPLTFFAGIGGAGREGVLVKGSNYLELLSRTKTVAFDKTGTLTQGIFEVAAVCPDATWVASGRGVAFEAAAVAVTGADWSISERSVDSGAAAVADTARNTSGCDVDSGAVAVMGTAQAAFEAPGADGALTGDGHAITEAQLRLLRLAAHAERYAVHPIAASLRTTYEGLYRQKQTALSEVTNEAGLNALENSRLSGTRIASASPETTDKTGLDALENDRLSYGPVQMPLIKEAGEAAAYDGEISQAETLPGFGVRAIVDGKSIHVGNAALMERIGVSWKSCEKSGTILHVAEDGVYAGHIVIADVLKPHAKEAIQALRHMGVSRTVLLTGDSAPVAHDVAKALGIDTYYAELLPADKVEIVEALLEDAAHVPKNILAFVGDGINDAPVLSRADVGIAMGAMGSDAAIEAADIVLMDDDPLKIAKAIRISRKCLRIVHQNIYFAIGVKLLCLLLGALGLANMWLAIFADVGVMVLAVLNAIRALFVKRL